MVLDNVGDYQLLETLGAGSSASAFKAKHSKTGDIVALKILHERIANQPDVQNRFVREVSVLQKLSHPNIVRHVDCGLDDGRLYFIMEWVEYGALEEVLVRRGRLPWREAVESALQVCAGLAHAHERGILHRDLKPANLFLSADGKLRIGDFGLARDENLHRLTITGNTVGSCRYMAPEQVRGETHLTGAVDLYALGCLLFRMLSGDVPFDGVTIMEIFEHHLFTEVPPLRDSKSDWPEELDVLVDRLLTKNPAERPSEAREIQVALQTILDGDKLDGDFTTTVPSELQRSNDGEQSDEPSLTERLIDPDDMSEASSFWPTMIVVLGIAAMLAVIMVIASRD
ncbi:MAG: serine/threonine-protein kinase [Aeoliella sp.]